MVEVPFNVVATMFPAIPSVAPGVVVPIPMREFVVSKVRNGMPVVVVAILKALMAVFGMVVVAALRYATVSDAADDVLKEMIFESKCVLPPTESVCPGVPVANPEFFAQMTKRSIVPLSPLAFV